MATVNVDVKLKSGVDQDAFVSSFDEISEVTLKDKVESLLDLVVLTVEESYLSTLESNSDVESISDPTILPEPMVTYPTEPVGFGTTSYVSSTFTLATEKGEQYLPYQCYYDTDQIQPQAGLVNTNIVEPKLGAQSGISLFNDDYVRKYEAAEYFQKYTGKHVDIVIAELATTPTASENHGDSHWDFTDPDGGSFRAIKQNWGITGNNQTGGDPMFGYHGLKALSCAIGRQSGFAKKASGRIIYHSSSTASELNAIKSWHDSKAVNPATGLKNPTIVAYEFQYTTTFFNYAIKCEDIVSLTTPSGTVNRPSGGWGSDLSPFKDAHIIPRQLLDPTDSNWYWVVTFNRQGTYHRNTTLKTATEQMWDAGITVVDSGGNYTFTFVPEADEDSYYCTTSGTTTLYTMTNEDPTTISRGTTSTTRWYPHYHYGAGGLAKCITTAAGRNSENNPVLDGYTSRGPAVELIGRGLSSFCAGRASDTADAAGFKWGTFGGNSASIPTVVGKLACIAEKYYVKNGVWPTPDQLKSAAIAESRPTMAFQDTVNWSNVPTASATTIMPTRIPSYSEDPCLQFKSGTTYFNDTITDRAGTNNRQCFVNARGYNREHTYKKRPLNGVLYPRPRKFDIDPPDTPQANL